MFIFGWLFNWINLEFNWLVRRKMNILLLKVIWIFYLLQLIFVTILFLYVFLILYYFWEAFRYLFVFLFVCIHQEISWFETTICLIINKEIFQIFNVWMIQMIIHFGVSWWMVWQTTVNWGFFFLSKFIKKLFWMIFLLSPYILNIGKKEGKYFACF